MQTTRRKFIKTSLWITLCAALADAFILEKYFIETNEYFIGKATNDTISFKVLQISDLHLNDINYPIKQIIKKINILKPDLIVFTGDSIDKSENISLLNDFLKQIDKDIKKVAITGNWEYWGKVNISELKKIYSDYSCSLLINETMQMTLHGKTISITGVDDLLGGQANIELALKEYQKSDHHIILNHCPEYNEVISQKLNKEISVDFILSGHTHGGQINILGITPFLPNGSGRFVKGWYNGMQPKVYVSKGIGTSIFPVRFGARAEIAVFNF
jgi:predicted MPP superfamily phosphohydrolase